MMYFSYKQDDIVQGLGMVASQLEVLNTLREIVSAQDSYIVYMVLILYIS